MADSETKLPNGEQPYNPEDSIADINLTVDVTLPVDAVISPQKNGGLSPSVSSSGTPSPGDNSPVITIHDGGTTANSKVHDIPTLQVKGDKDGAPLAPAESIWTIDADGSVTLRSSSREDCEYKPQTVHTFLKNVVDKFPDKDALSIKRNGIWIQWTYSQYYECCRTVAKAFLKLGLEKFHGVGIIGFNSPEWFMADIGAMFAGGFATGIYTTNSPEACEYVAGNCEANIIVVENTTQLKKILKVWPHLPHLKAVIQYSGVVEEKRENLYSWSEMMEIGKKEPDGPLDAIIASQKPNQCCTLIYTSGTTGNPKGVMLSHDNVIWIGIGTSRMARMEYGVHKVVSYLPLSHIAAQVMDLYAPIALAGTTYFAQPDALKGTLVETLREVRPSGFMGVPRVWEKIYEQMRAAAVNVTGMKKKIAAWAKGVGYRGNIALMNGQSLPWGWSLAKMVLFKKVRNTLGLDRCTLLISTGAPLAKEIQEYFLGLNVPLYDVYGMSESTGPHTLNLPDDFRLSSVGKTIWGGQTKIMEPDADGIGEVCYFGRHVFMGYLNNLEKTKEAIDDEGWLHSGDLGYEDKDGFIYITGRIKELIITAGGENIPPVLIEDEIKKKTPLISNCMLIGDKRKFLSLFVTLKVDIDQDTQLPTEALNKEALAICKQLGSNAKTVEDAEKDEAIAKHIQNGIDEYNKNAVSRAQKVQKFKILRKEFSVAGGELGPTLKLKRPVVIKMYAALADEFYADTETPRD